MQNSFNFFFDSFDRFVGNPHQKRVHSMQELQHFIATNNGTHSCFTTVNSFQNSGVVCRTIFNDFDADFIMTCKNCGEIIHESDTPNCSCGNSSNFDKEPDAVREKKVIEKIQQAQKLFQTYKEYGIDAYPQFSGRKGIHLLPMFKPEIFNNSDTITNLFYFFIEQSKLYEKQRIKICLHCERAVNGGQCVCGGTQFKDVTYKVPFVDTVVVSDLRRLIRIPGTRRPDSQLYCTPIDPSKFLSMEASEIIEHAKSPSPSVKVPEPKQKLSEFKFKHVNIEEFKVNRISPSNVSDSTYLSLPDDIKLFIKMMIPQACIKNHIATLEPVDYVRYAAVVHFRTIGCTSGEIIELMSKMNWRDFSYDTTKYRVENIYGNKRCKFSHRKMMQKGLCDKKNCGYRK